MLFYSLIFLSILLGLFLGIFTSIKFIKKIDFNNNTNKKHKIKFNNIKNIKFNKNSYTEKNNNKDQSNEKYINRLKKQKDIQNNLDMVEIMNALDGNDSEEYLKSKRAKEDKNSFSILKKYN